MPVEVGQQPPFLRGGGKVADKKTLTGLPGARMKTCHDVNESMMERCDGGICRDVVQKRGKITHSAFAGFIYGIRCQS